MFEVRVRRIDEVSKHPDADRLTLNRMGDIICISNLQDDGTPRYAVGDLAVHVPVKARLPEWLLKHLDYWDVEKGKGILGSKKGNMVERRKMVGIVSEGMLIPVKNGILIGENNSMSVTEGMEVSNYLDITR